MVDGASSMERGAGKVDSGWLIVDGDDGGACAVTGRLTEPGYKGGLTGSPAFADGLLRCDATE